MILSANNCELINYKFCVQYLHYNYTGYPNFLGQGSQLNAILSMSEYTALAATDCYKYTLHFACSLLFPQCLRQRLLSPCKSFCIGEIITL